MKTTKKILRQVAEKMYKELRQQGLNQKVMCDLSKEFESVCSCEYALSLMIKHNK